MMEQQQLGNRIRAARERLNLTQEQLSAAIEIPRSSVSEIENGRRSVSASELMALSEYLRRPLSYFVASESEHRRNGPFTVRFRSLGLSDDDDGAVNEFEQSCRAYQWIEQELQIRRPTHIPNYPYPDPIDRAEAESQGAKLAGEERGRMKLGSDPVRDPFEIVESQGVRVFVRALKTQNVSGIFHHDDELGTCLLINASFHPNRRTYDLLHEYCHALADRPDTVHRSEADEEPDDLTERRANSFAAHFLLPTDGIDQFMASRGIAPGGPPPELSDVFTLMVSFNASYQATLRRLVDCRYLTRRYWDQYRNVPEITKWTDRYRRAAGIESQNVDDPKSRLFGQLVLRAYAKDVISIGRMAELLNVNIDEARDLAQFSRRLNMARESDTATV